MPTKRRKKPTLDHPENALDTLCRLWMLRLLVPLKGHLKFVCDMGYMDNGVACALGLLDESEVDTLFGLCADFDETAARRDLGAMYRAAERGASGVVLPGVVARNIARLAELLGLSRDDQMVLAFVILLHGEQTLADAAASIGPVSDSKLAATLAVVLGLSAAAVAASLSPSGRLNRSGIVCVDRGSPSELKNKLDLVSARFADHVLAAETDPVSLLRDMVRQVEAPLLTLAHYEHIGDQLKLLKPYLAHCVEEHRPGVNILVYGSAGTGKSQLGRVLSAELGCDLFEISCEDSDGDPIGAEQRLRAYRAAQNLLAPMRGLLIFDEVEDIFGDGGGAFFVASAAQKHKAWINRSLEENPVPVLWLSNSIRGMDAAFLRRFDMVIELPVPARRQRERNIRAVAGATLDESAVNRLADSADLSPAVLARAGAVVQCIGASIGTADAAHAIETLVSGTLVAQGHRPIAPAPARRPPVTYDPGLVNADTDLVQLASGLEHAGFGRLCLYGPAGTGKTAFGRWLAEQLGCPLVTKRASDLLSRYVGGTELRLAAAFRVAQQGAALLMIDEVDSFLRDRRGAETSWEVSAVNEMLTQMESFDGVFVASTNLVEALDPASLRRFDIKVGFSHLSGDQVLAMLANCASELGLEAAEGDCTAALTAVGNLTPGDFASVARSHAFRPFRSGSELADALLKEARLKQDCPMARAIGFV